MLRCVGKVVFNSSVKNIRHFAAAPSKKGKAPPVDEAFDLSKVAPVNVFKDGSHPEIKEDSEYPEWLFTLLEPKPTLGELERKGFENLTLTEQKRYLKLSRREQVKKNNASKAKK